MPAHLPVEAAYPIDRSTAAQREVGHIERLTGIMRILPSQGHQVVEGNAQFFLRVPAEIMFNETGGESIETCLHGGVGREEISPSGHGQRRLEGLSTLSHKGPGPFQNGKSRVSFVEMTNLGMKAQGFEQTPAADAEDHFLLQP
jgi:hypothetical protein